MKQKVSVKIKKDQIQPVDVTSAHISQENQPIEERDLWYGTFQIPDGHIVRCYLSERRTQELLLEGYEIEISK